MKDGRPSVLTGIRLFDGNWPGAPYLEGFPEVWAFAEELANLLNAHHFAPGAFKEAYIYFRADLPDAAIERRPEPPPSVRRETWWFQEFGVGLSEEARLQDDLSATLIGGIISALKFAAPNKAGLVEDCSQILLGSTNQLRFLLRTKDRNDYRIEATFSVGNEPGHKRLHVGLTRKSDGVYFEAEPLELVDVPSVHDLVGSIKIAAGEVVIDARKSVAGEMASARLGWPWRAPLSLFYRAERPDISGPLGR